MSGLSIRILGGFDVSLEGEPVVSFESDKARALLAYLAAESGRAHRREALAGLLWPELPERSARMNLRGVLSNLRQVIQDEGTQSPRLLVTRQSIQLSPASDDFVDVSTFDQLTGAGAVRQRPIPQLEQAVELYRGEFLHGLSLPDAAAFEGWLTQERQRLARQMVGALQRLAAAREERGAYETALRMALRLVDLEPLEEQAHRQVMRMQARLGRRAEALKHYAGLSDLLRHELDVDPADETRRLADELKSGRWDAAAPAGVSGRIRGYELRDRIGSGSFGAVYRGFQPGVGREVAIKVILPQYANQAEFIRRFEAEAQLVAQVEHPHIVPLFDYWREPEGAYLIMRLLRGGSLEDSLQAGPWDLHAASRLIQQITAALTAAHRKGVVHRDLKPANILLDEARNAYLSDFGIAWDLGAQGPTPDPGGLTGSPAYVSPEQIRSERVSPQTDIYSLGVVLFELVAGRHPFAGLDLNAILQRHLHEPLPSARDLNPKLPAAIDAVIQQATAKRPGDRFADAAALAQAFRSAAGGEARDVPAPEAPQAEPRNPYKGLRPFLEADSIDFHGRAELIGRLLEMIQADQQGHRILALVGPSGSGKSSLLQAGLIPSLRAGIPSEHGGWYIAQMRPGPDPFERLREALRGLAADPRIDLAAELEGGTAGLARAITGSGQSQLLLAIDQFEELFTLTEPPALRQRFLRELLDAVQAPGSPVHLILTLRADYYDDALQIQGLADLLRRRTVVVLPLDSHEMQQAIVGPAEAAGLELEPRLAEQIVADLGGQPGSLPLLQHTLTELFDRRDGYRLTPQAYRQVGGALGALAFRSEAIFTAMQPPDRALTRQLFLAMVQLSDRDRPGRRRMSRQQLIQPQPQQASEILEGFGRFRLLTFDRDPQTREPTVEIAHDAFLQHWPRLRNWIDAHRDDLRLRRQLSAAAEDWMHSRQDSSFLLRGNRLAQFEAWAGDSDALLSDQERAYLHASSSERDRQEQLEQTRRARELRAEKRAVQRLRVLVAVLAAATIGAIGLTSIALSARRSAQQEAISRATQQGLAEHEASGRATQQSLAESEAQARATQQALAQISAAFADQQARNARSRELALLAVTNLSVDPERSILLALQAAETTRESDGIVLPEALAALHQALQASRVRLTLSPAGSVDFSPDGSLLATSGPDELARIWDAETGELLFTLTGHTDRAMRAVFSPDGRRLATTSLDRTARIWDLASRSTLTLAGHTEGVLTPAWSPDGARLVTTGFDATARIWDTATGETLHILPHSGVTAGPDFSPDGTEVAIADDQAAAVRIWDVETGRLLLTFSGHTQGVGEAAFSPDGRRVASAGSDLTAKVWDAASGEVLLTLTGHTGWVFAVDFSPDGRFVATGGEDGTARLWDAATGEVLLTLAGHASGIGRVRFSPDGTRLGTASGDGTAKIWDLTAQGSRDWLTLAGHSDVVLDVDFGPDGSRLASASWDGTAKLWDAATGEELVTLFGHTDQLGGVSWSPDGALIATASYDGTARLWDASTGAEQRSLDHDGTWLTGVAFSPDGGQLLTGGQDGTLTVWEVASGRLIDRFQAHTDWVFRLALNPAGTLLATAGWDGRARLWDVASGAQLATLVETADSINSVAFGPFGRRLAAAGWDGAIRIWELPGSDGRSLDGSPQELHTLTGHRGIVWEVAFDPEGDRLASASFDNTVKLWDADSGAELLTLAAPTTAGLSSVAFSPDGRLLAAGSGDGTVRIYLLPVEELIRLARSRLSRSWTDQECLQYLGLQRCPTSP